MEKIPQLENCCNCLSLREGTKVYGFIHLTFAVLDLISIFVYPIVNSGHSEAHGSFFTQLVSCLIHFITTVMLLIGAYKEKPHLLVPWLVTTTIVSVLAFILALWPFSIVGFIVAVLFFAFNVYGILVVFSYYRILTSSTNVV